jgi:beta-lactamase class A
MVKKIFIAVPIILAVATASFVLGKSFSGKKDSPDSAKDVLERENARGDLAFVNPTVMSNLNKHFIINFGPLKKTITEIQAKYPHKTYVYFLYLNNGAWTGLNEREEFTAASTVKVPLAMAAMKAVEEGKLQLSDRYTLNELDLNADFGELYKNGADHDFSLEELIRIMLEQSDNTAAIAVQNILMNIGIADPLADVYAQFGWAYGDNVPGFGEGTTPNYVKINLKTLSNMFLALYNATYNSPEHSEKILGYLAGSSFNNKIVAGVPERVPIAHKIGVSANDETFSDCGIVYASNRHYILCVGSNGGDEKRAASFMAEISKAAYDYVINN